MPGVALGDNPNYPGGSAGIGNWDAVLTEEGFDHAKLLFDKFRDVSRRPTKKRTVPPTKLFVDVVPCTDLSLLPSMV